MAWEVRATQRVKDWLKALLKEDAATAEAVAEAVGMLAEIGPALGRPLVDRITGSAVHKLKELRPGSTGRSEIRILFAFDPKRNAILLVGGDKAGQWERWYKTAIPIAEAEYETWLVALDAEEPEEML